MANITTQTSSNPFYQARCKASTRNEQLSSREGAADILLIEKGRLYRIEKGVTNPYPEEVHMMADLYNAPELRSYYCKNYCPLGENVAEVNITELDRITIKALSAFKKVEKTEKTLLDITEDGIITEDEKLDMEKILKNLEELEAVTQNLRVWIKKNLIVEGVSRCNHQK